MKRKKELHVWIEGTIIAAVAMILSLIPISIGTGFSVSLGMIPMTVYSLRRGVKAGCFSAFIWGLLHFPLGQVYYLSLLQVVIEYIFAFGFTGLAGIYSSRLSDSIKMQKYTQGKKIIITATIVGTVARYFWHFIAGAVFWGSYAFEGMNPWVYSFIMNGLSGGATAVVTAIVLIYILRKYPQLYTPKDQALSSD